MIIIVVLIFILIVIVTFVLSVYDPKDPAPQSFVELWQFFFGTIAMAAILWCRELWRSVTGFIKYLYNYVIGL